MSRTRLSRTGRQVRGVKTASHRREEALTDHKKSGGVGGRRGRGKMTNSNAHRGSVHRKWSDEPGWKERLAAKTSVARY